MGGGHLNIGGRLNADFYNPANSRSALTNGFIGANAVPISPYTQQYNQFGHQDENYPPLGRHQNFDGGIPNIETSYASRPASNYGSPRDEDSNRFGMGLSPAQKGLSVLDAPLPASFDPWAAAAKNGPIASSVPAKFGLESPPSSLGEAKDGRTSEALRNLHNSAFGEDTRDRFNGIAGSPPTDEYFGKRIMHSQRFATKSKVMSASLPKAVDKDWEYDFSFEEDYLPDSLKDLMTPQEKARRGSRNAEDDSRPIHSGTGTPINEIKFGSPSQSSPSRWGSLFQRKEDEDRARTSAFGHVGSPLRNSSLHPGVSPSSRPISRPGASGDSSPFLASPPRQSSMSIISQQLQRTRLSRAESAGSESGLHPTRAPSNGLGPTSRVGERQISSSSIGGSGRFTTPIDEEHTDFLFNMEGMDDDEKNREKRNSGGWSYANAMKGRNGVSSTTNGVEGMFGTR